MADDKIVYEVEGRFDSSAFNEYMRAAAKARLVTTALGKSQMQTSTSSSKMANQVGKLDDRFKGMEKRLDRITNVLKRGLMPVMKLVTTSVGMLTKALLPAVIGLAGFVASLGTAKLALATVNVLTKGWTLALKGLTAGAAVALGGISMLSAAMTELKAAAAAPNAGVSRQKLQGIFGQLIGDPKIAAMGVDSIQSASAALLKMKIPVGELNKYLKELGDYGFYAGQGDAGKGLAQIIKSMQGLGTGKLTSQSLKQFAVGFGDMAPAIEEAGKAFVGKNAQEFFKFLTSDPKGLAKFNNGLDVLNDTLIGTLKSFLPVIRSAIDPFGQTLNDVVKGPLSGFRDFLASTLKDIMPSVVMFLGTRMPGAINKLQEWISKLTAKFKEMIFTVDPENDGFGGKVGDFFQRIEDGWHKVKPALEQMAAGWDVIWSFMKPILDGLGGMLGRGLIGGSKGLESAADKWQAAGEKIGEVFREGGPVETTLRGIFNFVTVVAKSLGPGLADIFVALKSPMYIFDEIAKHPEALRKIGDTLGKIAKDIGPIFTLIGDVIGDLLEMLPDVAKVVATIFTTIGNFATALQPVVSAFMMIADKLWIIKGLLIWMISKAVLGKLGSMLAGFASMIGGSVAGQNGVTGTLRTRIGVGALNAGQFLGSNMATIGGGMMMYTGMNTPNQGVADSAIQLGIGGTMAYAAGGLPGLAAAAAFPLALSAANGAMQGLGGNYQDYLQREDLGLIDQGIQFFARGAYEHGFLGLGGGGSIAADRRAKLLGSTEASAAVYGRKTNQQFGSAREAYANALKAAEDLGDSVDKEYFANLAAVGWKSWHDDIAKTARDMGMDFNELNEAAIAAGVDLSEGITSIEDGIKLVDQVASGMMSAGDILSNALDKFIYDPVKQDEFERYVASIPELITGMVSNLAEGEQIDPSQARSMAQTITERYNALVANGTLTMEQGIEGMQTDLGTLLGSLQWTGQTEAADAIQEQIDALPNIMKEVLTKSEQQKNIIDEMVAGLAEKLGVTIPEIMAGLDQSVIDVYNSLASISNLEFTITPSGSIYLSGKGVSVPEGGLAGEAAREGKKDGDSSSPLSRLLNTRRVHSLVDGSIGGRRTVTSMWRNTNLGSSNSDHVTGRALDVTGDNLGMYASRIRAMGGLAEFHGADSSRHLHVVPPELPMGDRPTPRVPVNMAHQPQVQQQFLTTVNPTPGMDEEMLARKTVRMLASAQKNMAERR